MCEKGGWVVLQNCHLSEKFMPELEKRCDELITEKNIHHNFRLWLTSYSCPFFPSSILQNGLKMTTEPPSGLKNNMLSAFGCDVIVDPAVFEGVEKSVPFKRLLFGLCFFHSVIIERRRFGPLGWNNQYSYTENDLRISVLQLKDFVDKNEMIPFEALWYLTGHCNYGGKVTDDRDRRCLMILLHTFYDDDLATNIDHQLLVGSDQYKIPVKDSYDEFKEYINTFPLTTPPGIFGFHVNASITKELNETSKLIESLLDTRGAGNGSTGGGNDKIVQFIDDILEVFPVTFNTKEVR